MLKDAEEEAERLPNRITDQEAYIEWLKGVDRTAIALGDPDFTITGAVRLEGDVLAIRRVLGETADKFESYEYESSLDGRRSGC